MSTCLVSGLDRGREKHNYSLSFILPSSFTFHNTHPSILTSLFFPRSLPLNFSDLTFPLLEPPPSLSPRTVSVLEDDSQGVSPQKLVVVDDPQRLHLRVHVPTLLHTGKGEEGQEQGGARQMKREEQEK